MVAMSSVTPMPAVFMMVMARVVVTRMVMVVAGVVVTCVVVHRLHARHYIPPLGMCSQ
jgi:hypothetical protein